MKKIEHKIIKDIEYKQCSKCKRWKILKHFNKNKNRWDNLTHTCKKCQNEYYNEHVEEKLKYQKNYNTEHIEQRINYNKQYNKKHTKQKTIYNKQYNKNNTQRIAKQKKQYNKNNTIQIAKRQKQHNKKSALFKNYYKQLKKFEEIRRYSENQELLEVKCAYCGKWILPTNLQITARIQAFNGTTRGEHRFYCSENCKHACPIYNQKLWPKGFKQATSREVVPLLRQLVLARDNYTCQKCWATTKTEQLHVHHEKSYTLNKIMANDPDNCITLCKKCHKQVHSQKGCEYVNLKCKEI